MDPFAPASPASQLFTVGSARFSELRRKPGASGIDFAVADLTKAGRTTRAPVYGRNVRKNQYIASVGKVAAMVACYWLRRNFRNALGSTKSSNLDAAIEEVKTRWVKNLGSYGFPDVKKIFRLSSGPGVARAFNFSPSFHQDLRLMVGYSDTMATGKIVNALNLPYIAGVMNASRLYEAGKGGLYLGGDYNPRWGLSGKADPVTGKFQAGSPLSLVDLLSRLYARSFLSSSDSTEMIELMSLGGSYSWTSSWAPKGSITRDHFGKLGIYDKSYGQQYSDAAFMHRIVNLGGKHVEIKYAIAATKIRKLSDYGFLIKEIEYLLADAHANGPARVI